MIIYDGNTPPALNLVKSSPPTIPRLSAPEQ